MEKLHILFHRYTPIKIAASHARSRGRAIMDVDTKVKWLGRPERRVVRAFTLIDWLIVRPIAATLGCGASVILGPDPVLGIRTYMTNGVGDAISVGSISG
nr:hypothetical protein [Tanacetum cinerariifolium]